MVYPDSIKREDSLAYTIHFLNHQQDHNLHANDDTIRAISKYIDEKSKGHIWHHDMIELILSDEGGHGKQYLM